MKISVIIPIYNVEKYLRQSVDSVLAQTYSDLEIILVNDGSPDNCGAICEEYAAKDARVKYIVKENGGLVSAWTTGLKAATGELIGFVDSDDWIDPTMYEEMIGKMLAEPDLDLVVCNYKFVAENGAENGAKNGFGFEKDFYPTLEDYFAKLYEPFINPSRWNNLFKKDLLNEVVKHVDFSISYAEDSLVSVPYAKLAKKMYYLDKAFYNYRMVPNSMTKTINFKNEDNINKIYSIFKKSGFTDEELERLKINIFKLYTFHMRAIINSGMKKSEVIYHIKRIMNSKEFLFYAKSLIATTHNELYIDEKTTIKFAKNMIFKRKVFVFMKKTGLIHIYKKIRKR